MKVTYDPKADAIYIRLAAGVVAETDEVLPAVFADDDATGKVLGVKLLSAFTRADKPRELAQEMAD